MIPLSQEVKAKGYKYLHDAMYGMLNGVMILPVMISFTSIIFTHPSFDGHMTALVKLVLASSLVHQGM